MYEIAGKLNVEFQYSKQETSDTVFIVMTSADKDINSGLTEGSRRE